MGVDALPPETGDGMNGDVRGKVVAVVEELDDEPIARPDERAGGGHGTLYDQRLIIDRNLDQNARQIVGQQSFSRLIRRQLPQPIDQVEEVARDGELREETD